jgi:integrase
MLTSTHHPKKARILRCSSCLGVYLPTYFAVMTGLRRGEVLGLRWQDVDFKHGIIQIRQTVQQVKKEIFFKQPKSNRSRRPVTIPSIAMETLKKHKAAQAEQRLALGAVYQDNGLVFARDDGAVWSPDAFTSAYRSAVALKLGKKVRFHDLRHSHASQLLKEGIHPKVVSERLGHSSISITMDIYSHVLPGMQEEAASKIDSAFRLAIHNQSKT